MRLRTFYEVLAINEQNIGPFLFLRKVSTAKSLRLEKLSLELYKTISRNSTPGMKMESLITCYFAKHFIQNNPFYLNFEESSKVLGHTLELQNTITFKLQASKIYV